MSQIHEVMKELDIDPAQGVEAKLQQYGELIIGGRLVVAEKPSAKMKPELETDIGTEDTEEEVNSHE